MKQQESSQQFRHEEGYQAKNIHEKKEKKNTCFLPYWSIMFLRGSLCHFPAVQFHFYLLCFPFSNFADVLERNITS